MGLLLDSLEIKNFRAFDHLRVERLGRANLIVGKNNTGKSSLLEAVYVFASGGSLGVILYILDYRGEIAGVAWQNQKQPDVARIEVALNSLFYSNLHGPQRPATLSSGVESIEIDTTLIESVVPTQVHSIMDTGGLEIARVPEPALKLTHDGKSYAVPFEHPRLWESPLPNRRRPTTFVPSTGLAMAELVSRWSRVVLTPQEEEVTAAVRMVNPGLEQLAVKERDNERLIFAKLAGLDRPIPLRSLGEGANRILGMALVLRASSKGVLLIDEFENGLHYSVQVQIWKLVLQQALRLDVQVFATTHSEDCIRAFQAAAESVDGIDARLIRLEARDGRIKATTADGHMLSIIARDSIEVR